MGNARAEGSTAMGDRRQAAILLMLAIDETHAHIFESLQLECLYIEDLVYLVQIYLICLIQLLRLLSVEL